MAKVYSNLTFSDPWRTLKFPKMYLVTDRQLLLSEAPTLAKILLGRVSQSQRRKSVADFEVQPGQRRKSFSIRPRSSSDLTPSTRRQQGTWQQQDSNIYENSNIYAGNFTSDSPSDALFKPSSGNICLAYSPDA